MPAYQEVLSDFSCQLQMQPPVINIIATHFLFPKIQLNMRHATAKAMAAVFRMEKMTVRERSTDTTSSEGTPSYGITPPASQ